MRGAAIGGGRRRGPLGITRVNGTTAASGGTTATSLANNVPSGVVDDDLLLWTLSGVGSGSAVQPPTPSGWSVWQAMVTNGTSSRMTIFYRWASSEPASYTASGLQSSRWTGIMSAYRGVNMTTPQDATPTTSGSATQPSITTVTANAMVLAHGKALSASGVTNSTWSSTSGTVGSQVTQVIGANTNDTQAIAWQLQAVPGAVTPDLTVSGTTTVPIRVTSALRPI